MAAMNTWVLPDPDSPTIPTHSPGATSIDTWRTAAIRAPRCVNSTLRSSMRRAGTTSAFLHVEGVAQAVAEEVERQQQQRQKSAGHQQYPRRRLHLARAFGNQRTEAGMRLLDAEPQKAQEAFEHNDLRHRQRGVDDHRSDDVGNHVSRDDARSARPRGDRRLDEFAMPDAQGLAAHDARHGQPADRADGQKQEILAAAENDGQKYDEEYQRQTAQDFDDSHHELIRAPADVAGDRAVADAKSQADGAGHQADRHRDPCTLERAREKVAPQPIRPEPV